MENTKTLETLTNNEIVLTPKAVSEVKKIKDENAIPENYNLRVGVKGGGCSGLSYTLGFDSELKTGDKELDVDGVKVIVDWKSILYLKGTTIDYSDGLSGKGFVFNNPSAKKTCGCGSSFGV
ncbi:MAG: iron-sulfur cluster assembly accessory protein [Ignavibacteriae bacterium]|nr:MAG: iron-sulfur cluster assembly accessory protein [Ignavibacteriota bacterium]